MIIAVVAVGVGSAMVIETRPFTVGEEHTGSSATLTTKNGTLLATGGAHTKLNRLTAGSISSTKQLEQVQTIELDMPDNVKHVLKVSGFTFYNSTDIRLLHRSWVHRAPGKCSGSVLSSTTLN